MTSFDTWLDLMVLTRVGGRDSGLKFADELYNYGRKSQSQRAVAVSEGIFQMVTRSSKNFH